MQRSANRRVLITLSLALLLSSWMASVNALGAQPAAAVSQPFLLKACESSNGYNPYSPGQCTWYALSKRPDLAWFSGDSGNAKNWANSAQECEFEVDSTPQAGDIVVIPPGVYGAHAVYGHVAYVESVKTDGTIHISEYNGPKPLQYSEREIKPHPDLRFIHLKGNLTAPDLNGAAAKDDATFPTNTRVLFEWSAVGDESLVQVNPITAGQDPITSGWIKEQQWRSEPLTQPGQYTWRVRARNGTGLGPWSRSQPFMITAPQQEAPDQDWTWETDSFFSIAPIYWKFSLDDVNGPAKVVVDGESVVDTASECNSAGTIWLWPGFHTYQLGYPRGSAKPRVSFGPTIVQVACAADPVATAAPAPTSTPQSRATPTATPSPTPEPTATATLVATLPAAPNNVRVTLTEPDQVTVTWTDQSDNESWFDIFYVDPVEGYTSEGYSHIGTVNAGLTTFTGAAISLCGQTPCPLFSLSDTECYAVAAINVAGASDWVSACVEKPGPSGEIAYISADGDLSIINADGSNAHVIVNGPVHAPAWSPNGSRIAYIRTAFAADQSPQESQIEVVNTDGSGQVVVVDPAPAALQGNVTYVSVHWAPDGTALYYTYTNGGYQDGPSSRKGGMRVDLSTGETSVVAGMEYIGEFDVRADGTMLGDSYFVTTGMQVDVAPPDSNGGYSTWQSIIAGQDPAWSPDGGMIAVGGCDGLRIANPDGSDARVIATFAGAGACPYGPTWSPTGRYLAFWNQDTTRSYSVWVISTDGGDPMRLTLGSAPAWRP